MKTWNCIQVLVAARSWRFEFSPGHQPSDTFRLAKNTRAIAPRTAPGFYYSSSLACVDKVRV